MVARSLKLLLVASLCCCAQGTLRGIPEKSPSKEEEEDDDDDGETDLKLIAKLLKCSEDEAKAHLQTQEEFGRLVSKLEDLPGFAGSVMAFKPGDEVSLYFKDGVIPKEFDQDIEDFSQESKTKVAKISTKYSRKEQEEKAESMAYLLTKKGATEFAYVVSPEDELEFTAVIPEGGNEATGGAIKTQGLYSNHDTKDSMTKFVKNVFGPEFEDDELEGVKLEVKKEGPLGGNQHTYGGRKIGGCTTGFSVINILSGETGVSTAAHCSQSNPLYDAVYPEGDYRTSLDRQYYGYYGDFEWHTTNHHDLAEFYADTYTRRPVRSIDYIISVNDMVCAYSRVGRDPRQCDRVRTVNLNWNSHRRLVQMTKDSMVGGDSGSPWAKGNTAVGIHKGYYSNRDVFTPVKYLPQALGVAVRIQGSRTYYYPKLDSYYRVDWCKYWSQQCGKPAADSFCRKQGYTRATGYNIHHNIGHRTPTKVIGTNQVCNRSFCDGFTYIRCTS